MRLEEFLKNIGRTLRANYEKLSEKNTDLPYHETYVVRWRYYNLEEFTLMLEMMEFVSGVVDVLISIDQFSPFVKVYEDDKEDGNLIVVACPENAISKERPLKIFYKKSFGRWLSGRTIFTFVKEIKRFKKNVLDTHYKELGLSIDDKNISRNYDLKNKMERIELMNYLKNLARLYRKLERYIRVGNITRYRSPNKHTITIEPFIELTFFPHPVLWINIILPSEYEDVHLSIYKNPFNAIMKIAKEEMKRIDREEKMLKKEIGDKYSGIKAEMLAAFL